MMWRPGQAAELINSEEIRFLFNYKEPKQTSPSPRSPPNGDATTNDTKYSTEYARVHRYM